MGLKALRIVIGILGLVPIVIGATGIISGLPYLLPDAQISTGADGQYRYLSAIYLGFGCLLIWTQFRIEHEVVLFRILMATVFVAGVARAVSILALGAAGSSMLIATSFELVAPLLFLFWHAKVIPRP